MTEKTIFLNIHTKDLAAATTFYQAIGLEKNKTFSDDSTLCVSYSPQILFMIHATDRFKTFCDPNKDIVDATKSTEVLISLTVDTREKVHEMIEKAVKAGGRADPTKLPQMENMVCRSFEDLDGHIWEVAYMDMNGCGQQGGAGETADATAAD